MRTSGAGSEGMLIAVAVVVLAGVGTWVTGSPYLFLEFIERTLRNLLEGTVEWVRLRL